MTLIPILCIGPEDSCKKMELPTLLEARLKKQWIQQQALLRKEDLQMKYRRRVKFTGRASEGKGREIISLETVCLELFFEKS